MRLLLTVVILALSAVAPPLAAQAAQDLQAQPSSGTLSISVLRGTDAVNDILGQTFIVPVVEVRDQNDQPVEGAQVIFELPANGPSGFFPGNSITLTTRTNSQGQASAPFTPNGVTGSYSIQVTATSGDRVGQASILQRNARGSDTEGSTVQTSSRKKWWIIGGVAAAAVGITLGIVLSGGSSSSSSPTPTIVITPGPPVFGGP